MGAALVAAPFFIKSAPIVASPASWMFYLKALAICSLALFGADFSFRTKVLGLLIFGAAFTATNPYHEVVWHQMDYAFCALVLFASFRGISETVLNATLAVVCLISCAWLWLQKMGIDLHFEWLSLWIEIKREVLKPYSYKINGSLGHINHSLALIVATIPFLQKKFWIIPITTVLYFHTTLPLVCLFLGGIFYLSLVKKDRRYLYACLALVFILACSSFFIDDSIGSNGRIAAWKSFIGWHGFNIFGEGYGVIQKEFSLVYKSPAGEVFHKLHNELLELYAIGGFLWLGGFFYMIKPIFKKDIPIPATTCCFILLINSLGNFTFQVSPLLITFIACYNLLIKGEQNGSINS
jgi:hypothetical protein